MSQQQKKEKFGIIGGGLVGSLMAAFLAKDGFDVEVFERRADMRKEQVGAGRSINLAMSIRALHALDELGITEDIMKIAVEMRGRMIHLLSGETVYQPYSKDGKMSINSISRSELNKKLISHAERFGAKFQFKHKLSSFNYKSAEAFFDVSDSSSNPNIVKIQKDSFIAADGAFSVTRAQMLRSLTNRINYSQTFLSHGYKELCILPNPDGTHKMDKNCLHIWPRGSFMMIALPNFDGSFTVTLFYPFEGKETFADLNTDEKVMTFFNKVFPDSVPLMTTLLEDWNANPVSSLATFHCNPWSIKDKILLIGDAAHGIVPFYGQGMNAGFEDCSVLNECFLNVPTTSDGHLEIETIYKKFESLRVKNTDAIADMALENFIEMRDKTADPKFILRKGIERKLGTEFPKFTSRYELISFSSVPYAETFRIGQINDIILDELIKDLQSNNPNDIDLEKAKNLIENHYGKN